MEVMPEPTDRQLLLSIDRRLVVIEEHLLRRPIPKSHDHRQLWAALLGLSAAVISSVWWHP
jgi:hypothetical protein